MTNHGQRTEETDAFDAAVEHCVSRMRERTYAVERERAAYVAFNAANRARGGALYTQASVYAVALRNLNTAISAVRMVTSQIEDADREVNLLIARAAHPTMYISAVAIPSTIATVIITRHVTH